MKQSANNVLPYVLRLVIVVHLKCQRNVKYITCRTLKCKMKVDYFNELQLIATFLYSVDIFHFRS